MPDDSLLISTLETSTTEGQPRGVTMPCLTIACHPVVRRIGERALLSSLLVRKPARISRTEPLFAQPGGDSREPLADPYLSRDPIQVRQGAEPGSVILDGLPARAQCDGRPTLNACEISTEALDRGVLLQLSSRVLLLLHRTNAETQIEVDGMLGHSDAIERVRRQITRLAMNEDSVLVLGESGAGKELVAQALHALGKRGARPLVSVNMATLNDATAQATLFGHARGAFTGAQARHRGLFERADGGTLFLDEVGDTPVSVQPMLLRALETSRILPLGDETERAVDVRVIAATERDLEVGTGGAFRAALKHRLAAHEVRLPALRERPDDIPRLLVHFLRLELCTLGRESLLECEANDATPPLRAAMVARLLRHAFPGNVRELRNVARRLALGALETGLELDEAWLDVPTSPPKTEPDTQSAAGDPRSSRVVDEKTLLELLERHAYAPQRVAAELGVPPSTVHLWMLRANIPRAADLDDAELERVHGECGGKLDAMAKQLRVSKRALQQALRRKKLKFS